MVSVAALLFGSLALLLALGTPIAVALGLSSLITIVAFHIAPLSVVPQTVLGAVDSFTLLAIPFFMLTGLLLSRSAVARRLVRLAELTVGALPGGLGLAVVAVSILFAGISGSGPADVAALGLVFIPSMVAAGYRPERAAALVAAGGGIGIIVPPSIALIIYGVVAEASISKLFIAGIIPGILVGAALMVATLAAERDKPSERLPRPQLRDMLVAVRDAAWGLVAPLIILGGIYSGVFTPTEAAAVAVVYVVAVDLLIYRELKWSHLPRLLAEAATTSAVVMLIVACASLFAWVLNQQGIAAAVAAHLSNAVTHRVAVLLLANLVILLAGLFMDAISIFYIFVPLLLPALRSVGVDPVHFGIIMTVNLAIGQITPPVGVNLYVACTVADLAPQRIFRAIVPLVAAESAVLLLITFAPSLSLWLPHALGMK